MEDVFVFGKRFKRRNNDYVCVLLTRTNLSCSSRSAWKLFFSRARYFYTFSMIARAFNWANDAGKWSGCKWAEKWAERLLKKISETKIKVEQLVCLKTGHETSHKISQKVLPFERTNFNKCLKHVCVYVLEVRYVFLLKRKKKNLSFWVSLWGNGDIQKNTF